MRKLGKHDFGTVVTVYDKGKEVPPSPRPFSSKIIQLSVAILLAEVPQQLIAKMCMTNEVLSCHVKKAGYRTEVTKGTWGWFEFTKKNF